ncbi:unnamed protein product [Closterium sp. NIES-53]
MHPKGDIHRSLSRRSASSQSITPPYDSPALSITLSEPLANDSSVKSLSANTFSLTSVLNTSSNGTSFLYFPPRQPSNPDALSRQPSTSEATLRRTACFKSFSSDVPLLPWLPLLWILALGLTLLSLSATWQLEKAQCHVRCEDEGWSVADSDDLVDRVDSPVRRDQSPCDPWNRRNQSDTPPFTSTRMADHHDHPLRRASTSERVTTPAVFAELLVAPWPFAGRRGRRQRAAVASWVSLQPGVRVVLVGSHPSLHRVAARYPGRAVVEEEVDTRPTLSQQPLCPRPSLPCRLGDCPNRPRGCAYAKPECSFGKDTGRAGRLAAGGRRVEG